MPTAPKPQATKLQGLRIVIDSEGDTAVTHKCGAMVVLMARSYPGSTWCPRCQQIA